MFWEIFNRLCNDHNIKPNAVAKELAIPSGSVTDWKKGRIPRDGTLIKIADYFNVSTNYLLGKTNIPAADDKTNIGHITPHERAVLLAYREKTDMQKAVDQLLDVKAETPPSPSQTAEDPQDARLDRIIKLVDTRYANGELDPNNAKIAAFGGYENPVTGKKAEELAELKRLVQDVLEEQHKQENK